MASRAASVTGEVRLRLEPGRCFVVGRPRADHGLYSHDLATYDASDRSATRTPPGSCGSGASSVETWARRAGRARGGRRRREPRAA